MYIETSVPPNCRSARNNLYSGISLVHQVRSHISLPCSVSLCFWSFLVSLFPYFLVSLFPCFLVSLIPCFLVSLFPCFPSHMSRFTFPVSRPPIRPSIPSPFAAAIPISPFASAIPISIPVPVPVLVPVPRGSASRCFLLCSRAALLYKESSA